MINKRRPGYSLLELLIVVAIMIVLSTLVIVYSGRGFDTDLNTAAAEVAQVLRDAREKTLASKYESTWGVSFSGSTYSLFCSVGSCADEQTYQLPQNVQFNAGTTTVTFERLTGHANDAQEIILEQTGSASQTKSLYVSETGYIGSSGEIAVTDNLFPSNTRHIRLSTLTNPSSVTAFNYSLTENSIPEVATDSSNYSSYLEDGVFSYSGELSGTGYVIPFAMIITSTGGTYQYDVYVDRNNVPEGVDVHFIIKQDSTAFLDIEENSFQNYLAYDAETL